MLQQVLKITILFATAAVFIKCAQVVPLTGGDKDKTPPQLVEALPANETPRFNSSEIVLKFNEMIQLKDLKNQLIVSPRLKTDPEISAEGKKIKIVLKKEELNPNTTYRLYFGKAVSDITEGNSIANFQYVFSTGEFLDSLQINGKVTEAFNERELSDAVVGLYIKGDTSDSLVYKKIPDYISRTDNNGGFSFSHLPYNTFTVVAFSDKNKNLTYDGEIEKIAFRTEALNLQADTNIRLQAFQEEPSKSFIKKSISPYYGKAHIIYNTKGVFDVRSIRDIGTGIIYEPGKKSEKDTITLYYHNVGDTMLLSVRNLQFKKTDTVVIPVPKVRLNKLKTLTVTSNTRDNILPYRQPLLFTFFNMMDTLKTDTGKLQLQYKKDTLLVNEAVKGRFVTPYEFRLDNKITEDISYTLKIDTAAFYDVNGRYNDSMKVGFKVQPKAEFGNVSLKLLLNKKQAYVVQLLNSKEQVVREKNISFSLSSSNAATVDFTDVLPDSYRVKLIFDDNENGKWDTGNYLQQKQPEMIFLSSKQIKVLADWDVEEEILVK